MSWLNQFLKNHTRRQSPPGPPGSSETVIYERRDDIEEMAARPPLIALTLVNVGWTIVNVVVFALLVLS